jgi:RecB family exonuclease
MTEEVLESRQRNRLNPELIIVPGAPLARFVESHLAHASKLPLLNVQVMPLWLVPRRLLHRDVELETTPPRPMLKLAARYILREAAHGSAVIRRFSELAGIEESLLTTFHDLLESGLHTPSTIGDYLESDPPVSEIHKTTLVLYKAWLEALGARGLVPNQVAVSRSNVTLQATSLHLFGFTSISGVWQDFLNRLVDENENLELAIYYPCHPSAMKRHVPGYEFAVRLIEERMGGMPIIPVEPPKDSKGKAAAEDDVPDHESMARSHARDIPAAGPFDLVAAPGESGEVEAVARKIVTLLREDVYAEQPERIAVLAGDIERYSAMVRRVFGEFSIPISWLSPLSAAHHPLITWMQSILMLPGSRFARDSVVSILLSPFVSVPRTISETRRLSLEQRLFELCITTFDDDSWFERTDETEDRDWREIVRAFVAAVRDLYDQTSSSSFFGNLKMFVEDWIREDLLGEGSLLTSWLRELEFLDAVGDLDLGSGENASSILVELAVDELKRVRLSDPAPRGRGVVVGRIEDATGMFFDTVLLMGANRGQLPRRGREDPLLSDTERARIYSTLGYPMSVRANQQAHEKLQFLLTCRAASRRLFITYRHSTYAGKPENESLLLPLILGEGIRNVTRIASSEWEQELMWVASEDPSSLSSREAMFLFAKEPREGKRGIEGIAAFSGGVFWEILQNAKLTAAARVEDRLSIHDFLLHTQTGALTRSLRSAGAWRDLEKCPYRFFLSRVLNIPELKQPDALWSLSVLDEGNLVHKFLELLFKEGPTLIPNITEELERVWKAAVDWYNAHHPEADLTALVDYQIEQTKRWILPVAFRELQLVQSGIEHRGFPSVINVEYRPEHASVTAQLEGLNGSVTVPLSVRIDRHDYEVTHDGRIGRSQVIDYKVRSKEGSLQGDAESLQLFLYAEAMATIQGRRPDAAYLELYSGKPPESAKMLSVNAEDEDLTSLYQQKVKLLLTLLNNTEVPLFLAGNRPQECKWCNHAWYCKRYDVVVSAKSTGAAEGLFSGIRDINKELWRVHKVSVEDRYP